MRPEPRTCVIESLPQDCSSRASSAALTEKVQAMQASRRKQLQGNMYFRLISLLWMLFLKPSLSLDIIGRQSRYWVNTKTNTSFTIVGMIYYLSNTTTDITAADPLADPEICTRDAALFQRLGINTIYVGAIDPAQNHDDCFSIFNAVGIYIIVPLRFIPIFSSNSEDPAAAYTMELMQDTFAVVDAVKDYDNLLGVEALYYTIIDPTQNILIEQPIMRAIIRDTKEYISRHASRYIPTGMTIYLQENTYTDAQTYGNLLDYIQCTTTGSDNDMSRADFMGIVDIRYFDNVTDISTQRSESWAGYGGLVRNLSDTSIPVYFMAYRSMLGSQNSYQSADSWPDTQLLYDTHAAVTVPFGPISGGLIYEWANVQSYDKTNYGIVDIDDKGNVQLKKPYDSLHDTLNQFNLEAFYGQYAYLGSTSAPACAPSLIRQLTSIDFTLATQWALPTPPPGLPEIITYGNNGTRGQLVDVTVTTVVHTVKDSNGNVVTDLIITPSKSSPRSITGTGRLISSSSLTSVPKSGLSTGAKAGISVGAAFGGLMLIGVALFFLLRKQKSKKNDRMPQNQNVSEAPADTVPPRKKPASAYQSDLPQIDSVQIPLELPTGEYKTELEGGLTSTPHVKYNNT
ncbi:glycoside hydrolase family 72 protein [Cenococcum geophilum 1.58]|uniref:glycoside hydrolase family 72 protein n=1 Tax=Cenococcum geophilum 1.58 TaxID=794803 RepID=UPI00358EB68F|nr:glycoside hydrolase family 72 protein [Cenococcum geophilum 1.58]